MVLTNSERQKLYKEKRKGSHTALNLLITKESFALLATKATAEKLTKAAYVELLISNEPLISNDSTEPQEIHPLVGVNDELRSINTDKNSEITKLKSKNEQLLISNEEHEHLITSLNNTNDKLRDDNKTHLQTIRGLKAEIKSIKGANERGVAATKKDLGLIDCRQIAEYELYDNKALNADIAKLIGCKPKSNTPISNEKKPAKIALGYPLQAGARMTPEQNRAIFEWIKANSKKAVSK